MTRCCPRLASHSESEKQGAVPDPALFSFLDLDDSSDNAVNSMPASPQSRAAEDQGEPRATPSSPSSATFCEGTGSDKDAEGRSQGGSASSQPSSLTFVTVRMHNMPRNWMHEDIVEFVHTVGTHAGIPAPSLALHQGIDDPGSDSPSGLSSAIPKTTSPYVHRLSIPFGRRTGLIYGEPRITLASEDLAQYLVKDLKFDPDDYRSRIYFTREEQRGQEHGTPSSRVVTAFEEVEESMEQEQADALQTLELDRYLMAPDLLLDIAKMHQRRLVTVNEKVLLDSFLDADEDDGIADEGEDGDANHVEASEGQAPSLRARKRRRASTASAKGPRKPHKSRRAGDLKTPGRGSMHNTPIPKPYVQGRSL